MRTCVYVYVYVYAYMYLHVHVYVCMCAQTRIHTYAYTYTHTRRHTYTHTHTRTTKIEFHAPTCFKYCPHSFLSWVMAVQRGDVPHLNDARAHARVMWEPGAEVQELGY